MYSSNQSPTLARYSRYESVHDELRMCVDLLIVYYIQKPCLVVNMFFDFDSMLQGEDA